MPYKNKADRKAWRERNQERLREQKRGWWHRNKDKISEKRRVQRKKRLKRLKEEFVKLFPEECFLCGRTNVRLETHEINCKPHPRGNLNLTYILKNPEKFVRLCASCHKGVHWLKSYSKNINFDRLSQLVGKVVGA